MKSTDLPDNMLRRMRPEDRKALGARVMTAEEAISRYTIKSERDLQNQIADLLRLRGIWFDQDAMHKRRTGTKSTPDFIFCLNGKFVAWEVKFGNGKLDPGQEHVRTLILTQRGEWCLIKSVEQARDELKRICS